MVRTDYAITALLVAVAGFWALSNGIPGVSNWGWVAVALLAGLLASFIDVFRMNVLIREGAKSTVEYMSVQKPITISHAIGGQIMEQALMGIQQQMIKAIGKSLVAFEKVIELAVIGTAAFAGLVLILTHHLGWESHFALGLWIVLSTLGVALLMKVSGVFSFAFGLVSRMFVPLSSYTKKAKALVAVVVAAHCASWLLFAMQWWVLMYAMGSNVDFVGVFLLYALVVLFAFAPFSVDGMGWMELIAVIMLPLIGANAAAVFIAVVVWEATRMVGNSASLWLLTKQGQKKAMVEYR